MEATQTKELALLPTESEWNRIKEIATQAVKSGLLPSAVKTPEQAAIIALKGYELGLKPMVAFANIHVVNGKPGCSAELMLASIYQAFPSAEIEFVEMSAKACRIKAKRPSDKNFQEFSFTIDEARTAGLLSKDVWKNYAVDMLRARAITRMKRAKFPEILMGLSHTPEELGADYGDDGPKKSAAPTQNTEQAPGQLEIKSVKTETTEVITEAEFKEVESSAPTFGETEPMSFEPPRAKEVSRQELAKIINDERIRIKMPSAELAKMILDNFGVTSSELSTDQMKLVIETLERMKPKAS